MDKTHYCFKVYFLDYQGFVHFFPAAYRLVDFIFCKVLFYFIWFFFYLHFHFSNLWETFNTSILFTSYIAHIFYWIFCIAFIFFTTDLWCTEVLIFIWSNLTIYSLNVFCSWHNPFKVLLHTMILLLFSFHILWFYFYI